MPRPAREDEPLTNQENLKPTDQIEPSAQRRLRKVNHRKYTIKKCFNYLRKSLKRNGFRDFNKL